MWKWSKWLWDRLGDVSLAKDILSGLGLLSFGVAMLTAAASFFLSQSRTVSGQIGIGLFVFGLTLVVVGVVRWWVRKNITLRIRSSVKTPDQLYIHPNPTYAVASQKDYKIDWAPTPYEYFKIRFSDYESAASTYPPGEAKESSVSLYITNVGPGPARHVRLIWSWNIDLLALIRAHKPFGKFAKETSPNSVILESDESWSHVAFSLKKQDELPSIAEGETICVRAPEEFNNAFSIYHLSYAKMLLSKKHRANKKIPDFKAIIASVGRFVMPMDAIKLRLSYHDGSSAFREAVFDIDADLWAIAFFKVGATAGQMEHDPHGVSVWVRNLRVAPSADTSA
jgi:hypothetical protein